MISEWQELKASILGAVIRFWDNRFTTAECRSCGVLTTEISRLREQNSSLVDRLLNQSIQPSEIEAADSKLETIHRAKLPWHMKQRELELAHRQNGSDSPMRSDLQSFEETLRELEK